MKKLLFIIILALGLTQAASAQGDSEDRNVGSFTAVKAGVGIDVVLVQSPRNLVRVEVCESQYLDRIQTYVEKGVLNVRYSMKLDGSISGRNKVYVYAPEIREITAATGASIEIEDTLEGDHLKMTANTGADISGRIRYKSANITARLGSDIELEGKVTVCVVNAAGGSDVDIADLRCREVTATAKGGSDIALYAADKVDLVSSGGSDIIYYGNPQIRNIRASASSDITRRKE